MTDQSLVANTTGKNTNDLGIKLQLQNTRKPSVISATVSPQDIHYEVSMECKLKTIF
jgi:hypothetical protein